MGAAISALSEKPAKGLKAKQSTRSKAVLVFVSVVATLAILAFVLSYQSGSSQAHTIGARLNTYLSGLASHGQLSGTILVARRGKVLMDKGFGLANQQTRSNNGPTTRFGLGDAESTMSLANVLQDVESHLLGWNTSICSYLPRCVNSWKPITVRMVVDGTAELPWYQWGVAGNGPVQSLAGCEAMPLDAKLGTRIEYNFCDDIALAFMSEHAEGPWAESAIFQLPGLHNTGQLTNSTNSPQEALDYNGSKVDPDPIYNDYFAAYSTVSDLYAYDNALFGRQFLSARDTAALFAPRRHIDPPDPGVTRAQWGYYWKVGTMLGHRVVYTYNRLNSFQTVNMLFRNSRVTVIVLGNNIQDDLWHTATQAAAIVFGKRIQPEPTVPPSTTSALVGTYQRTFTRADWIRTRDPSALSWIGNRFTLAVGKKDFNFHVIGPIEYYNATRDGRLYLHGFNVGSNPNSFCYVPPAEEVPVGEYRWSVSGKYLTLTRIRDNHCADRASLTPGRWKRIA